MIHEEDIRCIRRQRELPWGTREPAPGWTVGTGRRGRPASWPSGAQAWAWNEADRYGLCFVNPLDAPGHSYHEVYVVDDIARLLISVGTRQPVRVMGLYRAPTALKPVEVLAAITWGIAVEPAVRDVVAFKVLESYGMVAYPESTMLWRTLGVPRRHMPPATCGCGGRRRTHGAVPGARCTCGYHAAYSPWELASSMSTVSVGMLVVQAVGRTAWHRNAWRAARYDVHAAVVPLDWQAPCDWQDDVPIVRAELPDIPLRAWEIAQEVRATRALEGFDFDDNGGSSGAP
jgi:hypothetical protein